ncbi:MAG: hypothetical protein ACI8RW_000090, partial [Porticoccaceae bacterium]
MMGLKARCTDFRVMIVLMVSAMLFSSLALSQSSNVIGVSAGLDTDTAEERSDGAMYLISSDLEIGYDPSTDGGAMGNQTIG